MRSSGFFLYLLFILHLSNLNRLEVEDVQHVSRPFFLENSLKAHADVWLFPVRIPDEVGQPRIGPVQLDNPLEEGGGDRLDEGFVKRGGSCGKVPGPSDPTIENASFV
jgi:hypothetical protein